MTSAANNATSPLAPRLTYGDKPTTLVVMKSA